MTASAWPDRSSEPSMCSGGTPIEESAAAPSSAALVMVRQPTGVLLTSPKQPQPTSGRRERNSARAATAVQNSTAVAALTASAGGPAPMRPAVTSRPTPRPNSLTQIAIAAGRCSRNGNIPVGPMPASMDRAPSARRALAAQPPMRSTASSGIWTSRATASTPAPPTNTTPTTPRHNPFTCLTRFAGRPSAGQRQRRVEAAVLEIPAQFHKGGHGQVRHPYPG